MRQHQPPKDFGPDEREVWAVAQRQLRLQGTWEKSDGPLLESYVHNVIAARRAREVAEEHRYGSAIERSAALKTVTNAEGAALALAKSLLLTPESRHRAGIKRSPGKAIEDELADLVG